MTDAVAAWACRKCGTRLVVGENCPQGRIDHHDYICTPCYRDVKTPYQRNWKRSRRGWVNGTPPTRPPYMPTGEKHGRWTTLEDARISTDKILCRCECGSEARVNAESVRVGHSRSCGCLRAEVSRDRNTKHGFSKHPLFGTWYNMLDRCTNPASNNWPNYGGRGITVCERWSDRTGGGFANFIADMGERPEGTTLERVNNDGPYSPENCTWATLPEQFANRRPHITNAQYAALLAENEQLRQQLTVTNP